MKLGEGTDPWSFRFSSAMVWSEGAYGIGVVDSGPIRKSFEIKLPKGNGHEPGTCLVSENANMRL